MEREGDPIPDPRSYESLRTDPEFEVDFDQAIIAAVTVFRRPHPTKRVNLSMDGDLLREIDQRAKSFPGGRSGYLSAAAREKISRTG